MSMILSSKCIAPKYETSFYTIAIFKRRRLLCTIEKHFSFRLYENLSSKILSLSQGFQYLGVYSMSFAPVLLRYTFSLMVMSK